VSIEPRTRRRGLRVDPERFNAELTVRGLEGQHLARLAGVSEDAVSKMRRGLGVDRSTLLKVVAALEKVPTVNELTERLAGLEQAP